MTKEWEEATKFEEEWHKTNNNCANSYNEETKQFAYAHKMGLDKYRYYIWGCEGWDFGDQTVLDVGGGPSSMLLKAKAKKMVVIDPCNYPNWVHTRYKECNVEFINEKAEEMEFDAPFDIVLSYNLLQHVEDPKEICKRMRKYGKSIHVFDWCEVGVFPGHPWNLHAAELDEWLGGEGKVGQQSEILVREPANPKVLYYAGIFVGNTER